MKNFYNAPMGAGTPLPEALLAGIATDTDGWHSKIIAAALAQRGIESFTFSLRDCHFDSAAPGSGVIIDAGKRLPEYIIVRSISAGTFEQITMRINILRFFSKNKIKVVNNADSICLCVDKVDCLNTLAVAGVAAVPCMAYESEYMARQHIVSECNKGNAVVCKPLFGAEGRGLQIFSHGNEDFNDDIRSQGVYVLQPFIGNPDAASFSDFRVLVIGGKAVAAMRRHSNSWITNVARGARANLLPLSSPLCRLAEEAAAVLGTDIAGVDLIEGDDGYMVLEVNAVPSWQMLQTVCDTDIASLLVSHIIASRPIAMATTAAYQEC